MWCPFIKRRRSTIKQSNILIIEEDESVAIPIAAALEGAGFQVTKTSDAFDGIRSIYQKYPDLIILDTELSIINEENAYNHIREIKERDLVISERKGRSTILRTTDHFADYFGFSHEHSALKRQLLNMFKDEIVNEDR